MRVEHWGRQGPDLECLVAEDSEDRRHILAQTAGFLEMEIASFGRVCAVMVPHKIVDHPGEELEPLPGVLSCHRDRQSHSAVAPVEEED
jgi:hypothetical protein